MVQQLIESYMDNYAEVKNVADETRDTMNTLVAGRCLTSQLRRFDLQVARHGQALSGCIMVATRILTNYNVQLNTIHSMAHRTSNQVQNSGIFSL